MPDIGLGGTLNVRMALTYLVLAILVVSTNTLETQSKATMGNDSTPITKTVLDPKRRNELIDETFSEQKDILLDMLETKLKEVRDKKKKQDRAENVNDNESKCESMPKNVDVVLKAHGISAIGETDVRLKYGEDGNGTLSLDATGISNVGKAHVELGVGDGNIHVPGLDNIFTGDKFLKKGCYRNKGKDTDNNTLSLRQNSDQTNLDDLQTRRVDKGEKKLDTGLTLNDTTNSVEKAENNDIHNNDPHKINHYSNKSFTNVSDNSTVSLPEPLPEQTMNKTGEVTDMNTLTSTNAKQESK